MQDAADYAAVMPDVTAAPGDLAGDGRPWPTSRVLLPGRVVLVHRRHGRSPAVVFEAGMGLAGSLWAQVWAQLPADRALLCYDRAGLGGSDPVPSPRSGLQQAGELSELLAHLGVPPPYVLVGHSAGAFVVRLFAVLHPERVAALVLVDPSQEEELPSVALNVVVNTALRVLAALAATSPGAVLLAAARWAASRWAPEQGRPAHQLLAELLTPSHLATLQRENQDYPVTMAQVRSVGEVQALPDVPLRVITARPRRRLPLGQRDRSLQRDAAVAASRPNGRHLIAPGSSHLVPQDAPRLIANAIIDLL